LTIAGHDGEAVAACEGLLAAADATDNPHMVCYALLAYGFAHRDADPVAAHDAHRRGLTIARESGNRFTESHLANNLARIAATHGEPVDAFDYITLAIRHYYDSGSLSLVRSPLAILATVFDRLGPHEPAATVSGCAVEDPLARTAYPEIHTAITHLRHVLGDRVYESLALAGKNMTNAAMANYALDQIDQARAKLAQ
jgi:hypothetical protein